MTRIHIEVKVNSTENPMKVKAAVLNIFPDAAFEERVDLLTAQAQSLEKLKELFRNQVIRDTARAVLRSSLKQGSVRFSLNKQTAFVGKVNFAPPSPLGEIFVTIEDEDIESVVDSLTAKREEQVNRLESNEMD